MRATPIALVCLVLTACAADASVDGDTEELSSAATTEAALVAATAPPDGATDPSAAAGSAAEALAAIFGECATSVVSGATVTWTLAGCAGPYGIVTTDGTIEAAYHLVSGDLAATVTIDATTAGGAEMQVTAEVVYRVDGAAQSIAVESSATGRGSRGTAFGRSGTYTVATDGTCVDVDGTWSGVSDWTLDVRGYHACTGACPTGTVTRTGALAATLTFDGTSQATLSTESREATIPLTCTP